MFREFFRFELFYWLRGWMIYIFLLVMTVLFAFASGSSFVQVGGPLGNAHKNSPFTVALWYASASVLTCFMAAAIYDSSASRETSSKMGDILFSKPLRKWGFLGGRFTGATLIAVLPCLGITLGILLGRLFNLSDDERWGPFRLWDHVLPFLVFAIPNTLLFGAVVFAIATVTRNTLYSFLGVLLLLIGFGISDSFARSLEYETLACMIDPFGASAYGVATKYWTLEERNTLSVPLTGLLIANRALWLAISAMIFVLAGWCFSFETRAKGRRKAKRELVSKESEDPWQVASMKPGAGLPTRTPEPSWASQFISTVWSDTANILGSPTFLVILCFAILNTSAGLFLGGNEIFGNTSFPVTYKMVDRITGSLVIFPIAIITYFCGVLVWRDRDSRIHEIVGATPTPNSVFAVSRLVTMVLCVLSILLLGIAIGVFYQWTQGYTRFQLNVYFEEIVLIQGTRFLFLIVAGLLAHTLAPNKYVGYALFVLFLVLNAFLWQGLRWESLLWRFGAMPSHVYSDMFGVAPYVKGMWWFAAYWGAVSLVLVWLTSILMHRGVAMDLKSRLANGLKGQTALSRGFVAAAALAALSLGGWLFYNTQVLNTMIGSAELERRQVEYEKKYQTIASIAQPKITAIRYEIDIFPETRNMEMRAKQTIVNKASAPIDTLYVNTTRSFLTEIDIPTATLTNDDSRLNVRTYQLSPPLEPQQSLEMTHTMKTQTRGIENQVSLEQIVQNGTFFNNGIAPSFGFDMDRRVITPQRRKALGLPAIESIPPLTRECSDACQFQYISQDSDWVDVETIISTSSDQIAVAPGSLIKRWDENGRAYFHYKLDHPSLNFYSFISAKYAVERGKVGDVDTEVYYHPEHSWNVPKMSSAIADTLEYCTKNFGPYRHKQARIIEFPRIDDFAQAFPGTMPYSESMGFIAKLEKPDDIDMVTYIVAHEMAHQWWAHQVIGARMEGATLLSETMAQYTALMIMRRKYGDDMMHKFLRYEMDNYLRSRGTEQIKERPLMNVDLGQGYIHYRKGSVALFYLAEMIGEDRINAALKEVVEKYAYQGPPYPNAYVLVDRLKAQTPPELHYLIQDLFEDITLFGNRTLEAKATRQADNKYLVQIKVQCQKYKADAKGSESEVPMDDWIEVGAFAKPEKGNRYGKLLYRKRLQLTSGEHDLEFVVDELPYQAGVDPRNLLIDRVTDDNLKTVTVSAQAAASSPKSGTAESEKQ